MKTKEFIREIISLPVDERALIVDSLLKSLNNPPAAIERKWLKESEKRLAELRSGAVKAVSGEGVFRKIKKRFGK